MALMLSATAEVLTSTSPPARGPALLRGTSRSDTTAWSAVESSQRDLLVLGVGRTSTRRSRSLLSTALQAVVSLRLVPRKDGRAARRRARC